MIDQKTRGVRAPETDVIAPVRARCLEDLWPAAAIECFAMMAEDELGNCASRLEQRDREKLFVAIGGGGFGDRTELAAASAKVAALKVGIPECDDFVLAVGRILQCEEMPLSARITLGNETADFWSLPTTNLPADAVKKMAVVCDDTRGQLEQRAAGLGCKL